jgi:hypothetical protein
LIGWSLLRVQRVQPAYRSEYFGYGTQAYVIRIASAVRSGSGLHLCTRCIVAALLQQPVGGASCRVDAVAPRDKSPPDVQVIDQAVPYDHRVYPRKFS